MEMTVIASIVLYKHSYEDIRPTLESLLNTSLIKKIVLIDNDFSSWADKYTDDRVEYIKSKGNYGFGYGHNQAIKKFALNSDFFLICNPDISFKKEEFEKLISFASSQKNIGLFLPKIIKADLTNQHGARLLPTPLNLLARRFSPVLANKLDDQYLLKKNDIDKPILAPNLIGCFMLFSSSKLLELDGFDEQFFMYMEDVDLSRRCYIKYGCIYYPHAYVTHLHEQGSYKNKNLLKAHIKSAYQYFNKWGWFFDIERSKINKNCLKQLK